LLIVGEGEVEIRKKVKAASDILEKIYGSPKRRKSRDILECLIVTILSQNTNDKNRDAAYRNLKRQFPTWGKLLNAPEKSIARAIKAGGLSNQKAAAIKNFLGRLKKERGRLSLSFLKNLSSKEVRELLGSKKGIGLKTVNVVLCFALGRDVFPVDTHVHRLARRLGFVPESFSAERTSGAMAALVPKGKGYSFHINLIRFGRDRCRKRNPGCAGCPLAKLCLYVAGKVKV